MKYVASVFVEDASGARFHIYEYAGRRWFRQTREFRLENGEPVRRLDATHFVVVRTGETLLTCE